MKWKIEDFNKVTFITIIIITSDLIGPNDTTTRTRFRSRFVSRRQEMAEAEMQKEMEVETTTTTEMQPEIMEMEKEIATNSSTDMMKELSSSSSSNMNVIADESRDTRGIRGFIPGFNLGGGNSNSGGGGSGRGLLRGLKGGGGGGLFGGLGLGGGEKPNNGNNGFPEFPSNNGGSTSGNSGGSGWSPSETTTPSSNNGWSQSSSSGSGGGKGGLFSSFPGASLFRNPFGGGKGGRGNGRGPFRLLSRLNQDQPCAAGLSSLPILSKLPFIPQNRFPSFIPSGVNTCDATCGGGGASTWRRVPPTKEEKEQMGMDDSNNCTYNWRDSLTGLPFLLFRCQCKNCPQKRVRIGGIFSSQCENVSGMKTRCKCPYGQDSYKCTITILPLSVPFIQRKKPYYCACCNENPSSPLGPSSVGGYDLSPAQKAPPAPVVQEVQQSMSAVEELGGYGYGGANSVSGTMSMEQGGSSSTIVQRESPIGRPLGTEHFYEHL